MRRLLLLSMTLLLAGCGGSEKDAYVEQASAVCERAAEETEALKRPAGTDEFAPYVEQVVQIAARAEAELAALEPPADDRAELEERVLQPFADVVEEGRVFSEKVKAAGNTSKLLPLLKQVPDAGEVDLEYLRDYGLDTCADAISRSSS